MEGRDTNQAPFLFPFYHPEKTPFIFKAARGLPCFQASCAHPRQEEARRDKIISS